MRALAIFGKLALGVTPASRALRFISKIISSSVIFLSFSVVFSCYKWYYVCMNKERKAQNICAKLQRKLITKHKWSDTDRKRWDKVIAVILAERRRQR